MHNTAFIETSTRGPETHVLTISKFCEVIPILGISRETLDCDAARPKVYARNGSTLDRVSARSHTAVSGFEPQD